ncbi:MAG: N-(5'-phosphoribosyl)anthranilate isomerase, partial [Wenzhouxiangellaceae bacterium]
GNESPAYCRAFGRPYIKALPMASPAVVDYSPWSDAAALLLDGHAPGTMGGSGERFDWAAIQAPQQSWMLAGGLHAENVGRAIRTLNPPAVDVSSGVESAPGIKDYNLMRRFMEGIRHDR